MTSTDKAPPQTHAIVAAAICIANAVWTVATLGAALISEATCGNHQPSQQQCGAGLGLGALWLMGELILLIPSLWAANVLVRAERADSESWTVRAGLAGVAAVLVMLVVVLAVLLTTK